MLVGEAACLQQKKEEEDVNAWDVDGDSEELMAILWEGELCRYVREHGMVGSVIRSGVRKREMVSCEDEVRNSFSRTSD